MSVFLFVFFGLLAGLRYFVDADYENYSFIFDATPVISEFSANDITDLHGEVGFLFVLSLFKSAGVPFFIFVLFSSFVSLWGKIYFYRATVGSSALAVSLYFCLYFINIEFIAIRWALATSFIVLGFYCKYNKNRFLTACFFTLSMCFHYYSLLFIVIAFLPLQRIKFSSYFALFFIVASVSIFQKFFGISINVDAVNSDVYIISRIIRYLINVESNVGLMSILRVLMYVLTFYFFWLTQKSVFNNRLTSFLLTLTMTVLTISIIFLNVPIFFLRGIVVGDLLSIALILRLISKSNLAIEFKALMLYSFTFLFMLWGAIDINKKLTTEAISEYQSWLQFLI
ncbi:MAG: hypothetical protein GQ532_05125 [Methylomarinum sp.]|nr:hypothetical protein [Methylomarinum sp.]